VIAILLRDSNTPSTPAVPTSGPSAGKTATPTATAPAASSPIEPAGQAFETATFEEGEPIPWHEGVFAMDTATGAVTGYRLAEPASPEDASQAQLLGSRWVAVNRFPGEFSYLHDRETGQSWRYGANALRLKDASPEWLVFAELEAVDGQPLLETGRFRVFSPAMFETAQFELANQEAANQFRVLVRGKTAAIVSNATRPEVAFADFETGATRAVFQPGTELDGKSLSGMEIGEESEDWFVVTVRYSTTQDEGREPVGPPAYLLQRVAWDGSLLETSRADGWYWHESVSPDGRYRIHQETLFTRPPVGEGSGELWPAVSLRTIDSEPMLRVRSTASRYGDNLPYNRWLADGSHFVAAFRGESADESGDDIRYGVVSLDGEITYLPGLPLASGPWYRRSFTAGPVPSPHDPDLFSFGRFYLYNRRADRWFIPNLEDDGGPAHGRAQDSPWAGRRGEMVFALGHGGHGGDLRPTLIEPMVEPAPYAAAPPMRFVVARTGSCLTLRESWSDESVALDCLADGTLLTLDPEGAVLWDDGSAEARYSVASDARRTWVMVNSPSGQEGWVAGEYLEWAPGTD